MILTTLILSTMLLAPPQDKDAQGVMERVRQTYAKLGSYQDTGVNTTFVRGTTYRQSFKTWFVRPNRWRFEYFESPTPGTTDRFVVWNDGNNARIWTAAAGGMNEKVESTSEAFRMFSFLSGPCSRTIPYLLDPKLKTMASYLDLKELRKLPDEKVGTRLCFKLKGRGFVDSNTTIWIDQSSLMLVKMEQILTAGASKGAKDVTVFKPVPNANIEASVFAFKPG